MPAKDDGSNAPAGVQKADGVKRGRKHSLPAQSADEPTPRKGPRLAIHEALASTPSVNDFESMNRDPSPRPKDEKPEAGPAS